MGCGQPQTGQSEQAEGVDTARFSFEEHPESKRIAILLDGQPYTSYCYADSLKKPVLYPLRTKGGHFITRGWPVEPCANEHMDYPHNIGMWLKYGTVNGLDFWNNSTAIPTEKCMGSGSIHTSSVNGPESSGNNGFLEVRKNWKG